MRKVFLDDLPRWEIGKLKGKINWSKSIGYNIDFEYDDIYGSLTIVEIMNNYVLVKYIQECYKISIWSFTNGLLARVLGKVTNNYKVNVNSKFTDYNRDILIIDRIIENQKNKDLIHYKNKKFYKYMCNKCGYKDGWIEEVNLLNGRGCSCCSGDTVVEGINDIPTTAPWMVKYFQGGYDEAKLYTFQSNRKIYPVCPDCGRIRNKQISIGNIYKTHSIGCSCSDGMSYPNKFMFNLLKQLHINFINEFSPNWIKPKRYDFYFEFDNNKYIIEMDGALGHGNKDFRNSYNGLSKEIDQYKDKLAFINDITVIRIDCLKSDCDYIYNNIVNSKLSTILNLKQVNWNMCNEFALSNLTKSVCIYKNNNPKATSKEIGQLFKLHKCTINRYLKLGRKVGWCNIS